MYIDNVSTREDWVESVNNASNYLVEVQRLIKIINKIAKNEKDKEILYLSNMIYISVSDRITINKMRYE